MSLCRCGNAVELGGAYCSSQCRDSDSLERPYLSPDFSPSVPPLVSSTRGSVSSTPPSSVRSSPSPRNALIADLGVGEEPPQLDLPSLANKFDYGGASLPIGLRYPSRLGFQQDGAFPSREAKSSSFGDSAFEPLDLTYRRRPGMGKDHIPAPLYYRQTARVHSSPALGPSSPPRATYSPLVFPQRPPSVSSVHAIAPFDLPPAVTCAPLPVPRDCGRPGCAGMNSLAAMAPRLFKRPPAGSSADLLLSPRIRALRGVDSPDIVEEEEEQHHAATEQGHSAFACYLFSQLSETDKAAKAGNVTEEESAYGRGRQAQSSAMVDEKRSMSADSSFPSRASSFRSTTKLFPSRGRPPLARLDSNDGVETVQSLAMPRPGHLISATLASPSSSAAPSPIPSPPSSPPTVSHRGRPGMRRLSSGPTFVSVPVEPLPSSIDPRGRSKLRGIGAIQRDYSPTRDSSESASRGRESNASNERGRISSGSRATAERDGSRRRSSVREVEEEERGRGRRDKSLLRRGRGYEVAISGAAYGHYDSP